MLEQLENCGMEFDHFILDNGSTDGTQEWLKGRENVILLPKNTGLWTAINILLLYTNFFYDYQLVLKLDNDLEFPEDGWLRKLVDTYEARDYDILTPFVDGICNGKGGPDRLHDDKGIGVTLHCGGASLLTNAENYDSLFPNQIMARGWDVWFSKDKRCGLVEDIHIKHDTEKQEKDKPDYYKRKVDESNKIYGC
jgi:glycosyltransferase involved in cell wall biosynthesis